VIGLAAGGAVLVAGALGLATATADATAALGWMAVLVAGYLLGLVAVARSPGFGARQAAVAVVAALVARAVLIPAPPVLEDDVNRYLWDGAVVVTGESPYAVAPQEVMDARLGRVGAPAAAARLVPLSRRAELEPRFLAINYPSVPTIYPPVAQAYFAGVAAIAPGSIVAIKLTLVAFDLATAALVVALLSRLGRPRAWMLAYLWSPLVLVSFAGAAHMDALPSLLVVAALYGLARGRPGAAGVALGLAIGAKLFAAIAIPVLARRLGVRGLLAAAVVAVLGFAPFAAEPRLFEGLTTFAQIWRMNEAGFALLAAVLGDGAARPVAGLLAGAIALTAAIAWRHDTLPARGVLVAIAALVLLAPAVNPWYVAWLVPLAVIERSRPVLLLSVTVLLYYAHFLAGPTGWLQVLEYLPVAIVVVLAAQRSCVPAR
jgi:alpha-1,6-mannosyltransferase